MNVEIKPQAVNVHISGGSINASTGTPVVREIVERDPYIGAYEVTPSAEAQTLATKNLRMTDDVVIQPIPSNYGLITWDGTVITVS